MKPIGKVFSARFTLIVLAAGLTATATLPALFAQEPAEDFDSLESANDDDVRDEVDPEYLRPLPGPEDSAEDSDGDARGDREDDNADDAAPSDSADETSVENGGLPLRRPDDPRRRIFWGRDFVGAFGPRLALVAPADTALLLYSNEDPLQFHGSGAGAPRSQPQLKRALLLPPDVTNLTQLIGLQKGNFQIIATRQNNVQRRQGGYDNPRFDYRLLRIKDRGQFYVLLNIQSDGEGRLYAELEAEGAGGRAGEYRAGPVQEIVLVRE